jgi:hypothetical protein
MRLFSRLSRTGGRLALLGLLGLLVAACDNNTPTNPTPVGPTPTRVITLGQAVETGGEPLTFKAALAKVLPIARQWNPGALVELGSLIAPSGPGAGAWTITVVTPDGQQRELISVSSVDTQTQTLGGSVSAPFMEQVKAHNPLFDQVLDSPAIVAKVQALNYQFDSDSQVKVLYYASAENVGVSSYPNPVVQVRILNGENAIQLTLDAITGDLISKAEQ